MPPLVAGVAAFAGTAIGGAIVSAGVSLALSFAIRALTGAVAQPQRLGERAGSETRIPIRQAIPDQRLALGTVTSSGALFFQRWEPPYIWIGYLLAAHETDGLEATFLNGHALALDAAGLSTSPPFHDGTTPYLEVSFRNGADDQAIDPILIRDFPSLPATFRQRGHTTAVIKAYYGADDAAHEDAYGSGGGFNPLFRVRGAKVYDPRAPGMVLDDPATWEWSDNWALCFARWLTHPWPRGRVLEPGNVNWDLIAAAADESDRWVGLKDGTAEHAYTANGIILSSEDPFQVARDLEAAGAGSLILDKGKYHVIAGYKREPVATFHQDMLAGGFQFQPEASSRDLANIVKTEFVAPDRDYQTVVGPVLQRDDLIATDGRPLEISLPLRFVEGHRRAQRLGKIALEKGRRGRALSAPWTIEASRRQAGDVVRVDLRDFPEIGGLYQIRRLARDETLGIVQGDLVAHDNASYDWNADEDEQDFTLESLSGALFRGAFTKVGSETIELITEAGGQVGWVAIVCAAWRDSDSGETPTTPTGWQRIAPLQNTVGGNHDNAVVWRRVLDGSANDNSSNLVASGTPDDMALLVLFYSTQSASTVGSINSQITNGTPSPQTVAASGGGLPLAVFSFAACRGSAINPDDMLFSDGAGGPATVLDHSTSDSSTRITVKHAAFAEEAPDIQCSSPDRGSSNSLISFYVEL